MRHTTSLKEAAITASTLNISLQNLLGVSIESSKEKYYSFSSKILMEPSTSRKTYWSVLKSFHNNKKIPCIPPIFHENRFVTNFKEKAELINSFFAKLNNR